MNSTDYDCPYTNYRRLLETRDFLMQRQEPHPNFFDIHINHIYKYIQVLKATKEVDQVAMPLLKKLAHEYDVVCSFDLITYLEVCNYLIGNVDEYQLQQAMEHMSL